MEETVKREVVRVSPHSNSIDGTITESTLPLTFFDIFWLKFPPVERLFFYQLTDLTHHKFNSEILPNLKTSLSQTLLHYLPLAGKLKWPPHDPKPAIFYSPTDGVSVIVAESNADFDRLSSHDVHEAIELQPLTPELLTSDDLAELIAIQITLFPNKGFSIGVSTHHAVFDGKSSTTFIKSWAYLCKSQQSNLPPELTPCFDRTVINDSGETNATSFVENVLALFGSDPNSRSLKVLPSTGKTSIQNCVRATFELSRDDFNKLRDKVHEYQVKESKKFHLSTFVLTCAHVFACKIKARGGDADGQVMLGFVADYRTRMEPPVPSNYFGNCLGAQMFFARAGEFMEENGMCVAADKLSEAIKGLENKGAIERLEEMFALSKTIKPGLQAFGTAGSNRFGVYGTDFGWGRPKKVEIVSIDTGSVSLAESRGGDGGVQVGVVLEKHEMEAFASFFNQGLKFLQ